MNQLQAPLPNAFAVRIAALWIYPVKSLGGMPLTAARLTAFGLAGDREWMVVDDAGGFITQRQYPRLAQVRACLDGEQLILKSPAGDTLAIEPPTGASQPVAVFRDTCMAHFTPSAVGDWLTRAVGADRPLHLVRFDRDKPGRGRPDRFGDATTHFADAAPYLVTNCQSLAAFNEHLSLSNHPPATMQRFRANIVIEGLPAFSEHQLALLSNTSLGAQLRLVDHCQRCAIITVDPATGEKDALYLLSELPAICAMPDKPKAPAFGVNSVLSEGDGRIIAVGQCWTVSG